MNGYYFLSSSNIHSKSFITNIEIEVRLKNKIVS
jgi:hypothetical protein